MKWWDQLPWILVFWMLSFKSAFSLFSFTFITRLFSSSSLSAIRVVSSAYLRLLIFLPAILIPAVLLPAQHFSLTQLMALSSWFLGVHQHWGTYKWQVLLLPWWTLSSTQAGHREFVNPTLSLMGSLPLFSSQRAELKDSSVKPDCHDFADSSLRELKCRIGANN